MEMISRVDSPKGPAQLQSIRQVLINLRRRELVNYLRGILDDASVLSAVAVASSIHANGFSKLVLERSAELALRLHVWEPPARNQDMQPENIHDHVWSFGSRVLFGGLGEQRFEAANSGEVMDHYRYVRTRGTLPPGRLDFLGRERLIMSDELYHPSGTVYYVDDMTLHRAWTVKDGGYAATLVLTGSPRGVGASVYTDAEEDVREDSRNAKLSPAAVQRLIGVVVDALQ